jgi:U3 small nucleolar RNA-associated protein 18
MGTFPTALVASMGDDVVILIRKVCACGVNIFCPLSTMSDSESDTRVEEADLEEQRLTNDLFGHALDAPRKVVNSGESDSTDDSTEEDDIEARPLFIDDRDETEAPSTGNHNNKKRVAVWEDEDDEEIDVDLTSANRLRKLQKTEGETVISGKEFSTRLRQQHKSMNRMGQKWAELPADTDRDNEEDIADPLQTTGGLLADGESALLLSDKLKVDRLGDGNRQGVSKCAINSVRFHRRTSQLMLTAGLDKTLRLFSIDGVDNPKVQSIFIRDLPIMSAEFFKTREEIILAGRRPFFYSYDLISGKVVKIPRILGRKERSFERFALSPNGDYIAFHGNDGYIVLLSGKTKQWVANMKMNGAIRNLSFTPDSKYLLSSGEDGDLYTWDMRTFRCINRHKDEGCVRATALAAGSKFYASGSNDGVVNLYKRSDCMPGGSRPNPTPLKAVMSLTTRVDSLRFSHDENLLLMSSTMKKDSLKILHVPSRRVFSNWPTSQTPLRHVTSVDFTANSGMMAIGNDRGRVLLYSVGQYSSA